MCSLGRVNLGDANYRSKKIGVGEKERSLSAATGKLLGVNHRPAVKSLADLDALTGDGRQRKAQLVVLDFQKLRSHRYALTDFGGGHMPHVHVNTHRLFVFVQVRRYQEHASVFHETNHRRRRENIGRKLLCPHLERRYVSLRVCKSGNHSVFHPGHIS
jgi:hypothetical protein